LAWKPILFADWKASGAFYKSRNIPGLVDFSPSERQPYVKLIPPIPSNVSRLIPPAQLEHTLRHFGAYSETIDTFYGLVRFTVFPAENEYRKFTLSELKSNPQITFDFSWVVS